MRIVIESDGASSMLATGVHADMEMTNGGGGPGGDGANGAFEADADTAASDGGPPDADLVEAINAAGGGEFDAGNIASWMDGGSGPKG